MSAVFTHLVLCTLLAVASHFFCDTQFVLRDAFRISLPDGLGACSAVAYVVPAVMVEDAANMDDWFFTFWLNAARLSMSEHNMTGTMVVCLRDQMLLVRFV